ncbi:MAG: hypothetical protein GYA60_09500, partial [Candidatus Methanofastidiosa archaeon]|nr:hypothetical protein [Candidatus Methanofastidiosa archaeon]
YYNSGDDDSAYGVATDSQNNIIVTGVSENGSDSDYYTIKYDPNGNVIWEKSYDGKDYDTACGVATDSQNNAIVTGYSYNGSKNVYYTIKYQGSAPTRNKSLPIVQILKILKLYPKE